MHREVLLLCCLGAAGVVARAETIAPRLSGTPLMRVWRAEDYGTAVLNWRVAVHPHGLVYVCNNDAVLEFDGERLLGDTLYTHAESLVEITAAGLKPAPLGASDNPAVLVRMFASARHGRDYQRGCLPPRQPHRAGHRKITS